MKFSDSHTAKTDFYLYVMCSLLSLSIFSKVLNQRTLGVGGKDYCKVGLQFNKAGFVQEIKYVVICMT